MTTPNRVPASSTLAAVRALVLAGRRAAGTAAVPGDRGVRVTPERDDQVGQRRRGLQQRSDLLGAGRFDAMCRTMQDLLDGLTAATVAGTPAS